MTSPTGASRGFEPSVEAVAMLRARLQQLGFLIRIDSAHEVLRSVLGVEAARLDRHAHEAAAECLRSIQSAAREALDILTQGGSPADQEPHPAASGPASAQPAVSSGHAARQVPTPPQPSPVRPAARTEEPVDLAELVRRHLGEAMPADNRPSRPDTQISQPSVGARPPLGEPRRPVIKHPRKR
jgi:hypothetical protein